MTHATAGVLQAPGPARLCAGDTAPVGAAGTALEAGLCLTACRTSSADLFEHPPGSPDGVRSLAAPAAGAAKVLPGEQLPGDIANLAADQPCAGPLQPSAIAGPLRTRGLCRDSPQVPQSSNESGAARERQGIGGAGPPLPAPGCVRRTCASGLNSRARSPVSMCMLRRARCAPLLPSLRGQRVYWVI